MSFTAPQDLLEQILEGYHPTREDIERLRTEFPQESLYHDFKSGLIFDENSKIAANKKVRRYIRSFANSDGGLLILGIGECKGNHSLAPPVRHQFCPIGREFWLWEMLVLTEVTL